MSLALATSCGSQALTSPTRSTSHATSNAPGTSTANVHESTSAAPTSQPHLGYPAHGGGRLAAPVESDVQPLQIHHASLTTQNWATYDYLTGPHTITASAPAGLTDANVREVFWRTDAVPKANDQSCITWQETSASVAGEPIQPGLAMRIASVGANNEGIRAITLTENVLYAGVWLFNVHVWDTRNPLPMQLVKTFDVSSVVGRISSVDGRAANLMVHPPWHLCGRTSGSSLQFKIWTQENPEPSWNDPDQVFSVLLPPGSDYSGYSGGYIGHLHPGQSATAELPTPPAERTVRP